MLAGMFAFGLAYGWIYCVLVSRLENGWTAVFYCLFLASMMGLEEDWVQNLLQPARMCAVWFVLWVAARAVVPGEAKVRRRRAGRLADARL